MTSPSIKIGLLVPVVSLILGCATNGPEKEQFTQSGLKQHPAGYTVQGGMVPIVVGDTVAVSVVSDPAASPGGREWGMNVPAQRVQADGCIALPVGSKIRVAGLTPEDAACRIKGYYVTNFTGVFPKVTVTRVQHDAAPNAAPPHR